MTKRPITNVAASVRDRLLKRLGESAQRRHDRDPNERRGCIMFLPSCSA